MSVLVPPVQSRTIGYVMVDGKRLPVDAEIAWFRYWVHGLFDRAGGATGPSTTEAATEANGNGGTEELRAIIEDLSLTVAQQLDHGRISELEALVHKLSERIDWLEQGPSI